MVAAVRAAVAAPAVRRALAGAAIFGVITAFLRNPDFGAPIRFLSYGVEFSLADGVLVETSSHWYEGFQGQFIGLVMLLLLGLVCFGLARLGARWILESEAATPGDTGGGDTGVAER